MTALKLKMESADGYINTRHRRERMYIHSPPEFVWVKDEENNATLIRNPQLTKET